MGTSTSNEEQEEDSHHRLSLGSGSQEQGSLHANGERKQSSTGAMTTIFSSKETLAAIPANKSSSNEEGSSRDNIN